MRGQRRESGVCESPLELVLFNQEWLFSPASVFRALSVLVAVAATAAQSSSWSRPLRLLLLLLFLILLLLLMFMLLLRLFLTSVSADTSFATGDGVTNAAMLLFTFHTVCAFAD